MTFSITTRPFTCAALAVIAGTALSTAAFAGSVGEPTEAPTVSAPPPAPVYSQQDWTGPYVGLQLGYGDADAPGLSGDSVFLGFHSGYDHDFGSYVLGGEIDFDQTDIDLGGAGIDSVGRLKLKGGYDLGDTLIYGTAGFAYANTSVGNENGAFYGIGATYRVNDSYSIGAELLEHRFDDVGGVAGNDFDATTLTLRGSLRF